MRSTKRVSSRFLNTSSNLSSGFTAAACLRLSSAMAASTETVIDQVDQLRWRDWLLPHEAATHLSRAVQRSTLAIAQADRALADLLQAVGLQPHLVVELIRGTTMSPRELYRQVPEEYVQPFQIRVLIGDHLAKKAVEVTEGLGLSAPKLRLAL